MPIPFTCENCGHSMKAPDKFAGKRVRCKQCNEFTPIPELESEDAPSFNPYALDDDEPVLPKRSAHRGDDLLGESPPPQEVLPKRIGMGDYGETSRRDRDRDGEAPVLGLPVEQGIWIFLGLAIVLGGIQLGMTPTQGVSRIAVVILGLGFQIFAILVNAGVMAATGSVVDIEASSFKRLFTIALAMNVVGSACGLVSVVAIPDAPGLGGLIALPILCFILARSLGLGCGGLIAFVFIEGIIYLGMGLVVIKVLSLMAPQQ